MSKCIVKVLISAALIAAASQAFAQGKAPAPAATPVQAAKIDGISREVTISRLLEDHVRQVLRRYVTDSEFNVSVIVETASKSLDKIPYLPPAQSASAMSAFAPARLVGATDKVTVQIALAKRYKTKTRTKLGQILSLSLGLRKDGGDSIAFEDLDLELPVQRSDIEMTLLRIEGDLRQERSKADQMRKERDDLKLEVVAAKTEAERQRGNVKTDPANPTKESTADTGAQKDGAASVVVSRLKDFGVPGIFALVALFFAFMLARSFGGIGRGIGEAANAVSRAIEASAGSSAAAAPTVDVTPEGQASRDSAGVLPAAPMESLQRTVKELHDDLSERLNAQTQPFVVQYLSQQFAGLDHVDKGVAAMELFGRDHANTLFEKLNPAAQTVVLDFIRQGTYSRPKLELMIEAGQELNTRLLGQAMMQTVSQLAQDINSTLMALQAEDLAQLVLTMPERLSARLFGTLEPTRVAAVLADVNRLSSNELSRVTELLLKIPELSADKDVDNDLLAALNVAVQSKSVDLHKPYLKFYGEIMAAAEDQVSETMFGKFMNNPQVANYIRRHTVTFGMFFQVTKEIQEDVLSALSIKDLAALYSGLVAPAEKSKIEALLPERRRDAVREEATQWARRGTRQLQAAHKLARQAVCRRLLTLQRDGGLDFQDESLAPLPSTPLVQAA